MTERIKQLLEQAESENKSGNRISAEVIAHSVLELIAEFTPNTIEKHYIALAHYTISVSLERRGMAEKALPHAEQAYSLISTEVNLNNRELELRILRLLGNISWGLAHYTNALEYYHKVIVLAEELGNHHVATDVIGNMGNIYWNLADYPRALENYHKALELKRDYELIE